VDPRIPAQPPNFPFDGFFSCTGLSGELLYCVTYSCMLASPLCITHPYNVISLVFNAKFRPALSIQAIPLAVYSRQRDLKKY
jgi:hypothetical protein